jgi:hypothetical protein
MSRLKNRLPSPALVVASLALFVALGGTVWAAARIDGRSVQPKSLPGNRLIVGSLPGDRLRPGAIGGNRIDSATLGRVPSAAHAEAADSARSADTAIHAQAADDSRTVNGFAAGCASGTRQFAGACWQLELQPVALTAIDAESTCAREGGELPRALGLRAFGLQSGVVLDQKGEWSGEIGGYTSFNTYGMAVVNINGEVEVVPSTDLRRFSCVLPLLH